MKTTKHSKLFLLILLSTTVSTTALPPVASAHHHNNTGVAVIGGLLAGHVLTNFANRDKERTQDMNEMAYSQQQRANYNYAQPRAESGYGYSRGGSMSTESRIKQLDKLAAGGYISPSEYRAKKSQILDSM